MYRSVYEKRTTLSQSSLPNWIEFQMNFRIEYQAVACASSGIQLLFAKAK